MKVILNAVYDPEADQAMEASNLDRLRRKLYGMGVWERSENGGLEITL